MNGFVYNKKNNVAAIKGSGKQVENCRFKK
jgi:hypothetical protein